jgi:hypothetical protein
MAARSRKLLVMVFFALPLLALAQRSVPGGSAITWHPAGAITVPFEYFQQHIYVRLSIDGKPGYVFMLDSGANRNVLNLRTARQLGIRLPRLNTCGDIGLGNGRIYAGPEEQVDAEIDSVPVARAMAVLDLNRFEQHFHHPTDGMLGYPFFRRFVVKLDFQRNVLTLLPPEKYRYRGLGVSLKLKASQNFVEMPVTVADSRYASHEIDVVVDTGSNITMAVYERYVHPLGLRSSYRHSQDGEAYGLNGYYPVKFATVESLQMGNAEANNLPMEYLQDQEEIGPEQNLPGAVGNGILQSFRVVIFDVPHRRMFLEVKPQPWQSGVQRSETVGP